MLSPIAPNTWQLTLVAPPLSPWPLPQGIEPLQGLNAWLNAVLIPKLIAKTQATALQLAPLNNASTAIDVSWVSPASGEALRVLIASALNGLAVDYCLQPALPAKQRVKRLLLSDMDSTLVQGECIDELAELAGVKPQVAQITALAMNGELPFEAALTQRVACLKGLPLQASVSTILKQTPLMLGAKVLCNTMKAFGAKLVVVSGGFSPFTQAVATTLGMDAEQANTLGIDDQGCLTGKVVGSILGQAAKVEALHHYSTLWGITPAEVLAVGDGANDLPMLLAAGLGVAFKAKPVVVAQARHSVAFGELSTLLYYQGIHQNHWVGTDEGL
jgi:phosphoserine phosphatase